MKCRVMWHFIWVFTFCQSIWLGVPGPQRVNMISDIVLAQSLLTNSSHLAVWPASIGNAPPVILDAASVHRNDTRPDICKNIIIQYYRNAIKGHRRFKKASECDQKIPQSYSADHTKAPQGRAKEHWLSKDIRKTVIVKQPALSSPSRLQD